MIARRPAATKPLAIRPVVIQRMTARGPFHNPTAKPASMPTAGTPTEQRSLPLSLELSLKPLTRTLANRTLGSVSKREPMALATGVKEPIVASGRPAASAVGSDAHGSGVSKQRLVRTAIFNIAFSPGKLKPAGLIFDHQDPAVHGDIAERLFRATGPLNPDTISAGHPSQTK